MGLLTWFRRKPPAWASSFRTRADFDAWVEVVAAVLAEGRQAFDPGHLQTGEVLLEIGEQRQSWILWDVAEQCAASSPDRWPSLLRDDPARPGRPTPAPPRGPRTPSKPKARAQFVREEREALARELPRATFTVGARTFDLANGQLDDVRPLIAVQLWSRQGRVAYLDLMDRDALIKRELADGLFAVVVFDLGESEINVPRDRLAAWGIGEDALFDLASGNILNQRVEVQALEVASGAACLIIGNGAFVAALALRLAELASFVPAIAATDPAHGWLVAVPNWHCLVLAPLSADEAAGQALAGELRPVVARLFDYVDSVSPDLFVMRGDVWTRLS